MRCEDNEAVEGSEGEEEVEGKLERGDEGERVREKEMSREEEEMEDGLSIAVSTLNLRLALPNPASRLSSSSSPKRASRGGQSAKSGQSRPLLLTAALTYSRLPSILPSMRPPRRSLSIHSVYIALRLSIHIHRRTSKAGQPSPPHNSAKRHNSTTIALHIHLLFPRHYDMLPHSMILWSASLNPTNLKNEHPMLRSLRPPPRTVAVDRDLLTRPQQTVSQLSDT